MKWFRSNIKPARGSRFLRWRFSLCFHSDIFTGSPRRRRRRFKPALTQSDLAVAAIVSHDQCRPLRKQQPPTTIGDQQPNDACAICAVIALANNLLFATPPLLVAPASDRISLPDHRCRVRSSELGSSRVSAPRSPHFLTSSLMMAPRVRSRHSDATAKGQIEIGPSCFDGKALQIRQRRIPAAAFRNRDNVSIA